MKKKILIIKLGALGDIVHTTIIASAIRQAHPEWQIDFLVSDIHADILKNHPHIDNVLIWEHSKRKSYKYLITTAFKLFNNRYDIVFNLTRAFRNNLLTRLAFPKKIVNKKSFDTNWVEGYFLTAKDIFKEIELPNRLFLGAENSSDKVDNLLKGITGPIFVIAPGGDTDKNRQGRIWNIENWKKIAEKINKELGGTIFVIGSKREIEKHQSLKADYLKITTGDFTISESSYLLSKADFMLSGDSGPAHIATAHNVKTLTILGSTTADKIKPFGYNGYSLASSHFCAGCWKKKCPYLKENEIYTPCMEAISVEEVFEKIKEIYSKSS